MNSLRWNPQTYTGSDFTTTFTSMDIFSNSATPISINVLFRISSTAIAQTLAIPYSTQNIICPLVTATSSGLKIAGSLPYGPFPLSSPIRPLCVQAITSSSITVLGDISFHTDFPGIVNISSAVILDASLVYPSGFTPITFTGAVSTMGQIYSAIQISLLPDINLRLKIKMPQVTYPNGSGIHLVTDVAILKYDTTSGSFYTLSVDSWSMTSPSALLSISASLQSGIYIFGHIDRDALIAPYSLVTAAPVQPNTNVNFYTSLGIQAYSLQVDNLTVQVNGSKDSTIAIMKPSLLYPIPVGYNILYMIYISQNSLVGASKELSLRLAKPSKVGVWAFSAKSNYGDSWNFTVGTNRTTNGSIAVSAYTNNFGLWALIQVESATVGRIGCMGIVVSLVTIVLV